MKIAVSVFLLVMLGVTAGCSTTSVTKRQYHGAEALQINCSGIGSSWDKCYAKAQRSCRSTGYRVLAKTSDVKEDPDDSFMGWSPGLASRTMFVRCNAPA